VLAPEVGEDRLLGGAVRLRQPRHGYRVAIDAVLLAAAVPAADGDEVADLGAGVGAAALCLLARCPGCRVTGFELQPGLAALAAENARLNGVADRFSVVAADIAGLPPDRHGRFDCVMANPPFLPKARADVNAGADPATVEDGAALADWVGAALALVRPKGTVAFMHRADRLDELLSLLRCGAGGIVVAPLWPRLGAPAKRVVVRARRGVRAPLVLASGLVLHDGGGCYTREAERVLRGAQPLDGAGT
jgi:tRNA1(Val) A37 N6-methylase TrmN6